MTIKTIISLRSVAIKLLEYFSNLDHLQIVEKNFRLAKLSRITRYYEEHLV